METATRHAHKAARIVAQAYQRVDGKGVALVWRVESLAEARERIGPLLFSKHGLMTVQLRQIAEFWRVTRTSSEPRHVRRPDGDAVDAGCDGEEAQTVEFDPGYILNGALQRSYTYPFDQTSPAIPIGPHWMLTWPF